MKTALPNKISTIEEAKAFLRELVKHGEIYHCEDNAHEVEFLNVSEEHRPTVVECGKLNKLMSDIYALPGNAGQPAAERTFDPCDFVMEEFKRIES